MKFIAPSDVVPRYFAYADGTSFLPIGVNLCFDRLADGKTESEVLALYRHWLESFSSNGGNFVRIWLGVPFFDVLPAKAGVFSEDALEHVRTIVRWCEELGIKIKFTLEHFRRLGGSPHDTESFSGAISFVKSVCSPLAGNMREFFMAAACRDVYLSKVQYLADAGIGDSPAVVAWELWNEINAVGDISFYGEWSDFMLKKLAMIFPRQMILQNLGSFSGNGSYRNYDYLGKLNGNAFLQVHRYLDPGAELDVCRGSMDVLAAAAVRELLERRNDCPAVLAETGAVEANHSCFSKLYEFDTEGTLLHDALFAAFFAGSAGCGQFWHWDHIYIDRHNLWWHFRRFAKAVEGLDVIEENFIPYYTETHKLRIYGLRGRKTLLAWCRDKASDWRHELVEKIPASVISGEKIPWDGMAGKIQFYLPWEDCVMTAMKGGDGSLELPDFKRSIVIRGSR